ncbi:cytidylate kinase [Fructilactobacillus sanfranciscensis]|uniref:(d)CMP kinase n=1 Tax=Fructilactobacillus sanfranciscensis TaxID=1625 RepID=UPI000CD3BE6D|nr:(d)CMP kinase [Fructilactobacillus sanfranciscensis]MCG7195673.1 (d)CMP kinase [Fructilactobacillus sanfranciscensis]MDN4461835.1 (d)CMP kinase [Fructilactobacillus sanfranciscensis]NDR61218.1 (d)CMP kinase [Fructilactobacillus sanfranciscensis]NDR97581.1 (d)CMP kinase [Fructilactobacillus sanfranciscensis]POH09482.1 cytidylate kinase [Fructilactobacillus sanfranciscensis]
MHKKGLQVAIDGPASAGKSTVAKIVAKNFNYIYVDTGAMYRSITYKAIQNNINLNDENKIVELLHKTKITFTPGNPVQHVFIDGEEVTDKIRSEKVTNNVSTVAALPLIRRDLVKRQQEIAKDGGVIMDGRDIGTTVLPNADLKIFLIASVKERAERRYIENQKKGINVTLEELKKEIEVRDYKDSHRKVSPLKKAKDAIEIDTTSLSIEQVSDKISSLIKKRIQK